jgi:para-aminobenzoate synthetase component 1
MSTTESKLTVTKTPEWAARMLEWAHLNFNYFGYFTSHEIEYPSGGFEHVFYAGSSAVSIENIDQLPANKPKVGILGYDQKNKYEKLESNNKEWVNCPESLFFSPELTIYLDKNEITIHGKDPAVYWNEILNTNLPDNGNKGSFYYHHSHNEASYTATFNKIQDHILAGDIYEMNFCMDFHGQMSSSEPIRLFLDLCKNSPMPFSALFKAANLYLCCASPERFLKKKGHTLLTQPIKGSIKRGSSIEEDEKLKKQLFESEKERAENLMIVDLMRNDLARMALTGTIKVDELFGIYSFRQITQMISTISCQLPIGISFGEIISKTFPMGSMTGAPKIKCMELIETYENFKRSWFSGCIGYIDEKGDFDFCVIIRSLIMDQTKKTFYFGVGSAITIDADARAEYQECLLKASPIIKTLENFYTITNNPY